MIANGIWCYVDTLEHPNWNGTHPHPCVGPNATAMAYDLHTHSWLRLPEPPTHAGRTTGTCSTMDNGGAEALFVLSGMGGGTAVSQLTLTSSSKTDSVGPVWRWRRLPELPKGQTRWLAAVAVADGFLVLAGGTNTRGFEYEAGGLLHSGDGNRAQKPCNVAAKCPPFLPGWRIKIDDAFTPGAVWSQITDFPGGGIDVPNAVMVNGGSLYMFVGWRANHAGILA